LLQASRKLKQGEQRENPTSTLPTPYLNCFKQAKSGLQPGEQRENTILNSLSKLNLLVLLKPGEQRENTILNSLSKQNLLSKQKAG
jgi:hypothetical protein